MKNMKILKLIGAFVGLIPAMVFAQDVGVMAQSFGGAIRARAKSNDIIFFNPAGILKEQHIASDADYLLDASNGDYRLGASIVDSQTGAWALGLAYSGLFKHDSEPAAHKIYMSWAMPIVTRMFALGMSTSYCYDLSIGPKPYAHFFNIDLGLFANFPYGISFALVGDNLLKPKGEEKALGLAVGAAFDVGDIVPEAPLSFSLDWLMDNVQSDGDLNHIFSAGMQYVILHTLPIRLGFKSKLWENTKLLSLGTGIITPSFSLDGLYQQDLAIGKNRHFGLALRLSL